MALTTHEKIRKEAGFQLAFVREAFRNSPDGSANTFYVQSDDNYKIVPDFSTGNTVAGISDVQVWLGLSGVYGVSRLSVSAVDIEQGSIQLAVTPVSGSSLVVNYSSSPVSSIDIETARLQAESIVNQRLALCYDLPITPTPSAVSSLATRLGAALLLIRGYGVASRSTSNDGYALYAQIMGQNYGVITRGTDSEVEQVGELGLVCTAGYQLVDDDGNIIDRNDSSNIDGNNVFVAGGRVDGRIFDITEEPFRKKPYQDDVNRDQPGSGIYG